MDGNMLDISVLGSKDMSVVGGKEKGRFKIEKKYTTMNITFKEKDQPQ